MSNFNTEFLNELLGKEDVSTDEKVKLIIAEHDADTRGLLQKRDELLGSQKKLKEELSAYETAKGEYETKIGNLEAELKKATSDDHKAYYETQLADRDKKYSEELAKITADRDFYKGEHLKSLRDKAIEEGIKNLNFVSGLKDGFIARVLSMNDFQAKDVDGTVMFLNKDNHTIEDAINAFASTQEGKAYIANPSTGGGARGTANTYGGNTKTMSRSAYNQLAASDPQKASEFFRDGGRIED